MLPFSFREFALFSGAGRLQGQAAISSASLIRDDLFSHFDGAALAERAAEFHLALGNDRAALDKLFRTFVLRGGFPETWDMNDQVRRQEYLFDNQVQKVVFEDLVAVTGLRKPENVLRFYLYLITRPGEEIRVDAVAREVGADRRSLEKYLRLLEFTDLVRMISNFSRKPLRVKRSNLKAYLLDLGVRNAVMKLDDRLFQDSVLLGKYAENLVYRTALGWREVIELSYYRQRDKEVDFVATVAPDRFLPMEVKYTSRPRRAGFLRDFTLGLRQRLAVAIQRDVAPTWREPVVELDLLDFLLIFG